MNVPRINHLLSPSSAILHLLFTFRTNLFSSLVGNVEQPYSDNVYRETVEWLDEVGLRYLRCRTKLELKKKKRIQMITQLIGLAEQCLDEKLLQHAKVNVKERVAQLKVHKLKIRYNINNVNFTNFQMFSSLD